MTTFLKENNIKEGVKRGAKLDGNASRDVLLAVDNLELALKNYSLETYCIALPFIETLRKFSEVVESCFKIEVVEGWERNIKKFSDSYRALQSNKGRPISVTPKVVHLFNLIQADLFFEQYVEKYSSTPKNLTF